MSARYRINYVARVDPYTHAGGGEAVLRALLDAGGALGHEIRRTCGFPRRIDDRFDTPDFWILADVHNMPRRRRNGLPASLVARIVDRERYVHFDNAYVDVCDLDYLPCNGEAAGDRCPFKTARWLRDRRCFARVNRRMYANARLNVFVSPLHRQTVQRLIGVEAVGRSFDMRPIIDTSRFRNEHGERDIPHLACGYINEAKGAQNLATAFPTGGLVLAGALGDSRFRDLGRQIGTVAYEDMPALFNRARVFVHLPRWPEPQGRTVAEAALCGCELMTNDRVGATSFGLDLSDPKTYEGALAEAWASIADAVERVA